jgi:hypothetical protein
MASLARDEDTDISGAGRRGQSMMPWMVAGGSVVAAGVAVVTTLLVTGVL